MGGEKAEDSCSVKLVVYNGGSVEEEGGAEEGKDDDLEAMVEGQRGELHGSSS